MPCGGVEHSACVDSSRPPCACTGGELSGESYCLEPVELGLSNRPLIEKAFGGCDLFCRIASPSDLLDVGVGLPLSLLQLACTPLRHTPTSGDEIDQCGEEGEDDQSNHPKRLPPSAQFFISLSRKRSVMIWNKIIRYMTKMKLQISSQKKS